MVQFLKDYGQLLQLITVTIIPLSVWFLGVQFQNRSSKRKAKLDLFLTLMAHRRKTPPNIDFVDSLNLIDVVFQDHKLVRAGWRAYYDSLNPASQHFQNQNDFLLDLLSEMANTLNYKDLKQTELARFYSPMYFERRDNTQNEIATEMIRVLKNSENFGLSFPEQRQSEGGAPQDAEVVS